MNRRCFLEGGARAASAAAVATALGVPLSGCIGFHYVQGTVAGGSLRVRLSDFGESRFVLVDAPRSDLPLYVFRQDDGGVTAVSTRCMHRGCQVEPVGGHLICPCHGSEYTNTGDVLKGPTRLPLKRLSARQEGDAIVIDLPAGGEPW